MFVEGGWKPTGEPKPRRPRLSDSDERVVMGFIIAIAALLLLAPIGGGTILQIIDAF